MMYGVPRSAAINGIDAAGYTDSVEPSAITRSAATAAAVARCRSSSRSDWPKLIVAGFSSPPQSHRGDRGCRDYLPDK